MSEEVIIIVSIVSVLVFLWFILKFNGLCKNVSTIANTVKGQTTETPENSENEPSKKGELDVPALIVVGVVVGLILLISFA